MSFGMEPFRRLWDHLLVIFLWIMYDNVIIRTKDTDGRHI